MVASMDGMDEKRALKLNLAAGRQRLDGFLSVDIAPLEGVDVVTDLTITPWPWADGSVEEVFCSHFVEHLDGDQFIRFMNELGRILAPAGKATIIAPYYTSMRAWQDPTHKRAIREATFLYFNKAWRAQNQLDHYPMTCDFDFTYGYAFAPQWALRNEEARTFALAHYLNVVTDLHVTLTKREPA